MPICKGLGSVYQVNPEAIIPDKSLSINEGAIAPLGEEREAYAFKQVQQIAKKNKFSLDKPVAELPERALNILLYGKETPDGISNGDAYTQVLDVEMDVEEEINNASNEYEGVVNMIRRWFSSSTTSDGLRAWVEKFMLLKTCPSCNGKRLKKESLWFKVDGKDISELSDLDLDKLLAWFKRY